MDQQQWKKPIFSTLNLPFLQIPPATVDSPEHPSTPPFQASASVPFKWEEQPGKPRHCSTLTTPPQPAKSLELPPCMNSGRFTKTPSPTTVLDGPYNVGRPKFSSFRFFRDGHESFDSRVSPASTHFEALLGAKKAKSRGFFGKLKGDKREFYGGSCRFSPSPVSSCDSEEERFKAVKNNCGVKMIRNGSFSTTKPSHLWTNIYQGIKQVMQWKSSKKSNKTDRD